MKQKAVLMLGVALLIAGIILLIYGNNQVIESGMDAQVIGDHPYVAYERNQGELLMIYGLASLIVGLLLMATGFKK